MRKSSAPPPARSVGKQPDRTPLTGPLGFMRSLWAVDHSLRSLSKRMQSRMGVTGQQRLVLRILARFPRSTPSQLAALLYLDRGTVSGLIDRLAEQRLVSREPHPSDGRSVLLGLSARGKAFDSESGGTVEACVRRALASLPARKVEAAIQVLEAIGRELARELQE